MSTTICATLFKGTVLYTVYLCVCLSVCLSVFSCGRAVHNLILVVHCIMIICNSKAFRRGCVLYMSENHCICHKFKILTFWPMQSNCILAHVLKPSTFCPCSRNPCILGPENQNVPKLLAIFAKALQTDALSGSQEVEQRVLSILRHIQVRSGEHSG